MPGPLLGVGLRGAGIAIKGVGKAIKAAKKSKKAKSSSIKRKKRRGRRDRNDPGFLIPLSLTGAAGVGILAKQLLEDRKKNRTGGR